MRNVFGRDFFKVIYKGTNQITYLIETMDKLTEDGDDHIAIETLKACFRTFLWS